jgi:D-alanyl-D-alanine carboxypeptidase
MSYTRTLCAIPILMLTLTWSICRGQQKTPDHLIEDYANKKNFNGTVLIYKDKKVIYEKGLGLANRQFGIPNKIDTKFKIASITKLFTAVLILQLYETGAIDLNRSIKTYLPNYQGEGADKVTIHQLLNSTSGIEIIQIKSSRTRGLMFIRNLTVQIKF